MATHVPQLQRIEPHTPALLPARIALHCLPCACSGGMLFDRIVKLQRLKEVRNGQRVPTYKELPCALKPWLCSF